MSVAAFTPVVGGSQMPVGKNVHPLDPVERGGDSASLRVGQGQQEPWLRVPLRYGQFA